MTVFAFPKFQEKCLYEHVSWHSFLSTNARSLVLSKNFLKAFSRYPRFANVLRLVKDYMFYLAEYHFMAKILSKHFWF